MNQKWLITIFGFFLFFIFYISLASATPPCSTLPTIVYEFENYYENVEIIKDNCYPSFSFTTPLSYSKFNIFYKVDSFGYNYRLYRENMTDYDPNLRKEISKIENCSGFEKYIELSNKNTLSLSSFMPDYDKPNEYCPHLQNNIIYLEKAQMVNSFLSEYKGDYKYCEWDGYSSSKADNKWFMYINCDDTKEFLVLVLNSENNITEAYFANSASEFYRKIYPEDIKIRERSPAWENANLANSIITSILIISILVIVVSIFYFFKKRKIKH